MLAALALAGVAAAASPAGAAPGAVAHLRMAPNEAAPAQTSSNWSGYAVAASAVATGPATSYRAVSGAWVQPAATCTPGKATSAAFWVGLGGFSAGSQALEQIGSAVDCSAAGVQTHSVWYELVPAASVPVKLKISAGDAISALVVVDGSRVTLRIKNITRRTVFTKRLTMTSPDVSSAEWIAEAPSACDSRGRCTVLSLTNFGTVSFSQAAAATVAAHSGTISDPSWSATAIELAPDPAGTAGIEVGAQTGGAVPSALSSDGAGFSVIYRS